jgi:hypothetical protein
MFLAKQEDLFKFGIYKAARHQIFLLHCCDTESETNGISLKKKCIRAWKFHANTESIIFFISIS